MSAQAVQPWTSEGAAGLGVSHAPSLALRLARGHASAWGNRLGWSAFGVLVVILVGQAFRALDPQDEGMALTYPWLIAHGTVPYRDIFVSYPPGTYLLLAPLFKVGLPGLVAERGLGLLARLAFVVVVNWSVTGSWKRFSWLAAPLAFSLMFCASDLKAYPWIIGLPLLFLALRAVRDHPGRAASLFFLAGLFRFEFALAGIVALSFMALPVFDRHVGRATSHRAARACLALLGANAVFYFALDLLTRGASTQQIFYDQLFVVQQGRGIPLFPPAFGPLGTPAVVFTLFGTLAMIAIGIVLKNRYVLATNFGVLVLLPHYVSRADASHLFATAAVVVPWMLICFIQLQREMSTGTVDEGPKQRDRTSGRIVSAGVTSIGLVTAWYVLIVIAYAVYISPLSPLVTPNVATIGSSFEHGRQTLIASSAGQAQDDDQVAQYLASHGSPNQSLFITPASLTSLYVPTDLYYLFGFRPASRYLEFESGVESQASVQREIMKSLRTCTWVVVLRGGAWYAPGGNPLLIPELVPRYIAQHYRRVMQNSTYEVMRRSASG